VTPDQTTAPGTSSATSSTIKEELSQDAGRLGDSAKERAKEEAETRKQQVTHTARSTSSALERAADELEQDDDAPSWLSSAFRQTASGIERLAGSVEGRSADQLASDLTRFARQNPGAFLAASAAAGFAAARFLRAGAEYKHEQRYDPPSGSAGSASSDYGDTSSLGQTGAGATRTGVASGQSALGGYGNDAGTNTTGTGFGSTGGYGSSTGSTEPAGYGSNPLQGGPA
jgi:hypothetical protein